MLTKEELEYICNVIPYREIVLYFKTFPKEFSKIQPGFRPTKIKEKQARSLLKRNLNRPFIENFIEITLKMWMDQIDKCVSKYIEDGQSKDMAILRTLPSSFFAKNTGLYFKLANENKPEEYIALMNMSVHYSKELLSDKEKLKQKERELARGYSTQNKRLKNLKEKLKKNTERLNEKYRDIAQYKAKLKEITESSQKDKDLIVYLENEKDNLLNEVNRLNSEIETLSHNSIIHNEKGEIEPKELCISDEETQIPLFRPKQPSNMDEFKEYLGYNFTNIGVPANETCSELLISYICKVAFRGIPIIVNHAVGINIMKCISNALLDTQTIKKLNYKNNITIDEIDEFLSTSNRIVCLDNFLGNYNETELIPLVDQHSDKIIFLTIAYDRTLYYISKEFFRYCFYLNANRVGSLSIKGHLTEDPAYQDEEYYQLISESKDNRFRKTLRRILNDLKYPESIIEHKCRLVASDQDLCEILVFDILPYYEDVLGHKPINASQQLQKYIERNLIHPHGRLIKRWFG